MDRGLVLQFVGAFGLVSGGLLLVVVGALGSGLALLVAGASWLALCLRHV